MPIEDDIARAFRATLEPDGAVRLELPPGPGPFILPLLSGSPGVLVQDENTAVFIFDVDGGRKVRLPIAGRTLPILADLIREALRAAPGHQGGE